ncbi:type IV pilus assembly protein FimV [Vreelandella nanhaiensis]|uniref:LysM peptidoglycan-binding domain-containing protein n=1 Tax=Vreelandella nanhaiensis TaxID=1258546 RepID=A0A3S0W758_9GAMM|nr:FimV/HubP family polar landmark protein [Halomonas nanhaiensis]RUR30533.1 LysM peptidoglycan-binding domain-containing protein [Halomonas nanhaiensis]
MFRKKLSLQIACKPLTLLGLGAASFCTLAVELGPASVTSPLQAPLAATIPLLDSEAYSLDELEVAIGKEPAFAAAGLEWMPEIDNVHTELQEQQGVRQVVVRSPQPISAPWLDLLLTVEYPEGQLTHPVTLLFDPSDYALGAASQATASSAHIETSSNSVLVSENLNTINGAKNVEVLKGDTLWQIALRSKPDHISVPQMMLALAEANPSIFPAGDINSLRAGQTLNVPHASQLNGRTRTDAAQAVQAMVAHGQHHTAQPAPELVKEAGDQVETRVAPVAVPQSTQGTEQGNAIAELAAQLNESQANWQQAQVEREQLRLELEGLRESVSALKERMSELQPALPDAIAPASAGLPVETAHIDQHGAHPSELLTGLERYQWPLISLALVLLLAGLIWRRKQREGEEHGHKQYCEDISLAGPAPFRSDVVSSGKQDFQAQSENIPLSCVDKTSIRYTFSGQAAQADKEGDRKITSGDAEIKQSSERADLSRSQAAGLTGQRLEPLVAEKQHINNDVPPTGYRLEVNDAVDSSGFVSANSTPSAPSVGNNTPNKTQQAQWKIEEVAFKPSGRDNS